MDRNKFYVMTDARLSSPPRLDGDPDGRHLHREILDRILYARAKDCRLHQDEFSSEELGFRMGWQPARVEAVLRRLLERGIVVLEDGELYHPGAFAALQPMRDRAGYMREYRAKKKSAASSPGPGSRSPGSRGGGGGAKTPRATLDADSGEFRGLIPEDFEKWRKDFPGVDVESEVRACSRWWAAQIRDGRREKCKSPRAAILNWLGNAKPDKGSRLRRGELPGRIRGEEEGEP